MTKVRDVGYMPFFDNSTGLGFYLLWGWVQLLGFQAWVWRARDFAHDWLGGECGARQMKTGYCHAAGTLCWFPSLSGEKRARTEGVTGFAGIASKGVIGERLLGLR